MRSLSCSILFLSCYGYLTDLYSFPTRRSSDLHALACRDQAVDQRRAPVSLLLQPGHAGARAHEDRKSTRLNSSHLGSSYAVVCLKKRNIRIRYRCSDTHKNWTNNTIDTSSDAT